MKLHYKGHALHVILAHFPSALLPAGLIFELAHLLFRADGLMQTAFYCESLGVIAGAATILAGAIDLYGLYERNEQRLINTALLHGTLNITATIIFLLINIERLETFPAIPPPSWGIIAAEVAGVATLAAANFLGANVHHAVIKRGA